MVAIVADPLCLPISFCGKTVPKAETAVRLMVSLGPLSPIQKPAVSIGLISAVNKLLAPFAYPTLHNCARMLYPFTLIFLLRILVDPVNKPVFLESFSPLFVATITF